MNAESSYENLDDFSTVDSLTKREKVVFFVGVVVSYAPFLSLIGALLNKTPWFAVYISAVVWMAALMGIIAFARPKSPPSPHARE